MGTWFQWIADVEVKDGDAPRLAQAITARLVEGQIILPDVVDGAAFGDPGHVPGPRWTDAVVEPEPWMPDGVRVVTRREVFWGGQGDYDWAQCPSCGHRVDPDETGVLAGVEEWLSGGRADQLCIRCSRRVALPAWRWSEDYFAFAALGLWFWGWPELGPLVHEVVREVVGEHRLVYTAGKL